MANKNLPDVDIEIIDGTHTSQGKKKPGDKLTVPHKEAALLFSCGRAKKGAPKKASKPKVMGG